MRISDWSSDVCSSDLAPIASVIYRILTSLMEAVLAAAGAFDTVRAVRGSAALMLLADLSAARYRSRVLWFCRGSGGLRGTYRVAGSWSDLLLYQDSTDR